MQMQRVTSHIKTFRGDHYTFGREQGEWLKQTGFLSEEAGRWRVSVPRVEIDTREARRQFERFAPQLWSELIGLQDALRLPLEDTLLHFGHYRVQQRPGGCSVLTGHNFLVRNYDYHPLTYDGVYRLFAPSDGGYATIGPVSRVTGRMDGMNEHGLAMGYNFVNRRSPGDGFVCQMIGRILLETCRDTEEAVALLREIPHRTSFMYVLHDSAGKTRIVEASPREVHVREGQVCTNHFELLSHENRHQMNDSLRRMTEIRTHQPFTTDGESAFRLLNDSAQGVFSEAYRDWSGTIHTTAYFPETLTAWFALGSDRQPVKFDFKRWLDGETLRVREVRGLLATDFEFARATQVWR